MREAYTAFLKHNLHDYEVIIPQFGVRACGTTIAEAMENARIKAIKSIDDLRMNNSDYRPRNRELLKEEYKDFIRVDELEVIWLDIDYDVYRKKYSKETVRRNVTLPEWLNTEAEIARVNVSKVLQDALMEKLLIIDREKD
nr:hypothetical protein [uncultured Anaerosporobacter sp.]